jgi:acyl-CoA dehydrogenase
MSLFNFIFKTAQRKVPQLSSTEAEAMNIGDPWWEADVLSGTPSWLKLSELRLSRLTPEEQQFLENETEILCRMLDDWHINFHDKNLPTEVWDYIKDAGFWGLVLPKEVGGKGFSAALHSQVIMKVATKSLTTAVTIMVPNSLGPGELLLNYGTPEQKNYYLPRLAKGVEIPCFALTGTYAGSDATSMPDYGVVCKGQWQGTEVLGVKLSFSKRYITLAPIATLIGLAVKFTDPEHLLGTQEDLGITLCLIERNYPGLIIGNRLLPLDQAFLNGTIDAHELFVPLESVIGGREYIGKGWQMLVECLATGRAISLPAVSAAYGALCYITTGAYAALREQFKISIKEFEGVQAALAQIGGLTYITEACRILTLTANDQNKKPAVASAIAKYHMTEMARKILNHAMDVHGGRGIMMGPHNYLGRAYQGIPICITVEGANILTRNLIIFGQGVMLDHPYLRALAESLQKKDELHESLFKAALKGFTKRLLKQLGQRFWIGLSHGAFVPTPESRLAKYYRKASILSNRLSLLTDIALITLGGKLKRKERLSARLGDVMSHLYLASAVLKYYQHFYELEEEETIATWAVQHCLAEAHFALSEFVNNFDSYLFPRFLLKWLIVPSRRHFRMPNDILDQQLAKFLSEPSALRERLRALCAIDPNSTTGMMSVEQAYQLLQKAKPTIEKIKTAIKQQNIPKDLNFTAQAELALQQKLINENEWRLLLDFISYRDEALQVDVFTFDLQTAKRMRMNLNISLEAQFQDIVERLHNGSIEFQPTPAQKLDLYGLYKQATDGDLNSPPPPATDFVARAKYQAWEKRKGMGTQEAMQAYINMVSK